MPQACRLLIFLLFSVNTFGNVTISPSDIDFGDLSIGDSGHETIYIENEIGERLEIEDISYFGDLNINVSSYCPGYLGPYQECEIEVEVDCDEFGEYEGSIDLELGPHGYETIFIYGECS